ncbi:MAG: His-Xaa-Ser system radical SAM maturase HxsB [bacterium]
MEQRHVTVPHPELTEDALGFFRWGRVADRTLISTDAGDWALLGEDEFHDLLAGRVVDGHARFAELQGKGFLRDGLDLDALATRMAQRNRHLRRGPYLHVVTLTRRPDGAGGNGTAADDTGVDMTTETAAQVAELVLQSTSPSVAVEFQAHAGEPLHNLAALRHFVEVARARNERSTGKALSLRVLSNFSALNEDIAEWLIANDVRITTSLDGPAALHDENRRWRGGSAHADVVRWIAYFQRRYTELGRDPQQWFVDALLTTTRPTLNAAREVVEEYAARGLRTVRLRPLDRARFDRETWSAIGYTVEEYLEFYRRTLDHILEANGRGIALTERTAAIILTRMLSTDDPGVVDFQSPHGAGTAQVAYNVDGRVFPSDEARIVDAMGDSFFALGHVNDLSIQDIVRHPTVRAIAAASLLDAQPMCADCWNKPFCGFSPVRNFITQGDLFGQRPHCVECKEHMAVSSRIIELLSNAGDVEKAETLKSWLTNSPLATDGRVGADAP